MIGFLQRLVRRGFRHEWREVLDLRPWLQAGGYNLVETYGPIAMNSAFDRYRGHNLGMLIESDRGFGWTVEIGILAPETQAFDLSVWASCVGIPNPFGQTPREPDRQMRSLGEQLAFVRQHLHRMEAAADRDRVSDTAECLTHTLRARQLSEFPASYRDEPVK